MSPTKKKCGHRSKKDLQKANGKLRKPNVKQKINRANSAQQETPKSQLQQKLRKSEVKRSNQHQQRELRRKGEKTFSLSKNATA
jgi:hypothetical protein